MVDSPLEGSGFELVVPREIRVRTGLASCGFTWAYSDPAARRFWPFSLADLKPITSTLSREEPILMKLLIDAGSGP
jgi:hypothetical protein